MARYGYNYGAYRGTTRYDQTFGGRDLDYSNRSGWRGGALEGYGGGMGWSERDLGAGGGFAGYPERGGYYGYQSGLGRGTTEGARWGGATNYGGYTGEYTGGNLGGYTGGYAPDTGYTGGYVPETGYTGGYTGGYAGETGYTGERMGRDWETTRGGGRGGWQGPRNETARDIMTENPETVTPDTTLADAAKRMRDLDVGIMPVVESEESTSLKGVITDRDIAVRAAAEGKDMKKSKVSDFMSSDVATCNARDDIRNVFNVMKREQVRRVPVVDNENRLVGIIAQADLAVDYAGNFDLQREAEVEEVVERISEPARPQWGQRGFRPGGRYVASGPRGESWGYAGSAREAYDRDLADRVREGWHTLKRGARDLMNRGYDQGWR